MMTAAPMAQCFHFVVYLSILGLWHALGFFLELLSAITCHVICVVYYTRSLDRSCFESCLLVLGKHPYLYGNSISEFLQIARSLFFFGPAEISKKGQSASRGGLICYRVLVHHRKLHRLRPVHDTSLTPFAMALPSPRFCNWPSLLLCEFYSPTQIE